MTPAAQIRQIASKKDSNNDEITCREGIKKPNLERNFCTQEIKQTHVSNEEAISRPCVIIVQEQRERRNKSGKNLLPQIGSAH